MKRLLPLWIAILIFLASWMPANIAQAANPATYSVQSGDTLYSIAAAHDTTVNQLKAANGLNSDLIWVGQLLVIPAASSGGSGTITYTVVSGDTLYSLARRYGTTVAAIMQLNHLPNTYIYIGQTLLIPASSTLATPSGTTVYTVVRGDTLYSIALRYGTTVPALMTANYLSSPDIYVGQQLIVPSTNTPVPPTALAPTPTPTGSLTPTATGLVTPTPTGSVTPATPTPTLTPSPTAT